MEPIIKERTKKRELSSNNNSCSYVVLCGFVTLCTVPKRCQVLFWQTDSEVLRCCTARASDSVHFLLMESMSAFLYDVLCQQPFCHPIKDTVFMSPMNPVYKIVKRIGETDKGCLYTH